MGGWDMAGGWQEGKGERVGGFRVVVRVCLGGGV